jgi:hypothetical protein
MDLRNILRRKIGSEFNNISDMLRGGIQGKEGILNEAVQDSLLNAVLDFAEASERFRSRAPKEAAEQSNMHLGHHRPRRGSIFVGM